MPDKPPCPPPTPVIFTRAWFESYSLQPIIPPEFRFRFPFNTLVYVLLPLIVPIIIILVFARFAVKTQVSRSRIKLLEKEAFGRKQKALLHVLAEIEREVEDAVADLVDSSDPVPVYQTPTHPVISANHRKIVSWLNTLPIHKEFAYFEDVSDSHAMIVCREVETFEFHRLGEPIVKHWAAHFVM